MQLTVIKQLLRFVAVEPRLKFWLPLEIFDEIIQWDFLVLKIVVLDGIHINYVLLVLSCKLLRAAR
jgi:hypothetical protein